MNILMKKTNKFISFNKKLYTAILFINYPKEYTGGENNYISK